MAHLLEKATRKHTRDHNLRLVLRTVYELGEISRAELARLTQLTRATVSEVVGELIERGLVEEIGHGAIAVGRTPILLSVVAGSRLVVAISVTNDAVAGALVDLRGGLRTELRRELPNQSGSAALEAIYALADRLVTAAGSAVLGIGVNTPGLIDIGSGTVLRSVNFGWEGLPLRSLLQARLGVPVYVSNDSHSLALAEQMFGQSQGRPNLVVVKIGNGIGAGIVLGGRLYTGEGYGAGEIGHLVVDEHGALCKCGNRGCLETVASAAALLDQARAGGYKQPTSILARLAPKPAALTIDLLGQAARAGDPVAQQIVAAAGRALGVAVASLVSVLNVQQILLTGRIAVLGELLAVPVRAELARRALPALAAQTCVVVAPTSPAAPILGAAAPLLTYELGLERLAPLARRSTRDEAPYA